MSSPRTNRVKVKETNRIKYLYYVAKKATYTYFLRKTKHNCFFLLSK